MPSFARVFTGAPWEPHIGYCRALRAGQLIFVTGTAPVDEHGGIFAPGDAYRQAARCLEIIDGALRKLGARRENIVRTRQFVADIRRWADFGRAHREFFANHPPCTTMIEVQRMIDPAILIEIEADAVCDETADPASVDEGT